MFQVDGRSSTPVEPLQPARTTFGNETSTVVADHLDSLLGEQLLPVRGRRPGQDEPHLLAVDAAGQPVVVEVVAVLDESACVRALRYAGQAARLSTQDLARTYPAGPEQFAAHLGAFRESVPVTALLSPTVRGGARLLLVCSEVDHGAADLLEFLLQPGWQVEVLQVGVIEGADGRRIVDVSPVTRTPPARREMEPTALRLVREDELPAAVRETPTPRGSTAAREGTRETPVAWAAPVGRSALTGPMPLVDRVPATTPVWERTVHEWDTATPSQGVRLPRVPDVVPPPFAVRASTASQPTAPAPDPVALDPVPPAPAGQDEIGVGTVEPDAAPPGSLRPDPALADLAEQIGEPVALVWVRVRRGRCHEALLRTDGLIELVDGSVHTDPDVAAAEASGAQGAVDGWRVWRLGERGPSLAEALEM